jgi:hypothetical protein
LQGVASLLSEHLFAGVPFVPTDEGDEVPGVRAERDVLGGSIRIFGETPQFGLHYDTTLPIMRSPFNCDYIDISGFMEERIALIEGITIIPT